MKPLKDLLSSARRARQVDREPDEASFNSHLADDVLRALREPASESDRGSDWFLMGRWAAGAACTLALIAVVAGPEPAPVEAPVAPPSNPLADFAGW